MAHPVEVISRTLITKLLSLLAPRSFEVGLIVFKGGVEGNSIKVLHHQLVTQSLHNPRPEWKLLGFTFRNNGERIDQNLQGVDRNNLKRITAESCITKVVTFGGLDIFQHPLKLLTTFRGGSRLRIIRFHLLSKDLTKLSDAIRNLTGLLICPVALNQVATKAGGAGVVTTG